MKDNTEPPIVGILSSIMVMEAGPFPGLERSYVNHDYVSAVETAGGIPLLLPVIESEAAIRRQVEKVDLLLCTGGYDPSPLLYGENPNGTMDFIFPEIDDHQLKAIRAADELGKPLFGICRGLQMINIAFGGTLYQDISLAPGGYIKHVQKSRRHSAGHEVILEKGSALAGVFGSEPLRVNSFHHLAVKDLAPGFSVSARAPDGIVEGIERVSGTPVVAVQWHPEMMAEKNQAMLGFFKYMLSIVER